LYSDPESLQRTLMHFIPNFFKKKLKNKITFYFYFYI